MIDKKVAYVYVENKFAGILTKEDGYNFEYDSNYLLDENAKAVSLTLPLNSEVYKSNILFPFFDGLIPEGWLLENIKKNWKITNNDRFSILLVACNDCIGNVQIYGEKL